MTKLYKKLDSAQRFWIYNKKSLTYSSILDLFPYICMLFLIILNKN
jgi:hypothetical protein